ncbi:MAG: hypothetical protein WCJ70_04495 [bacterium]
MDDIDQAIRKTKPAPSQDSTLAPVMPPAVPLKLVGLVIIAALILFVWLIRSWYLNREVHVDYSNIPPAEAAYTKMPKPLVHGEVSGRMEGANVEGRVVTFCLVKECEIYQKGNEYFLTGLKKDIKQVAVGSDGAFTQRLLPGSYFMNARGDSGEVLAGVPVRIDIKAGQIAVWDIQARTR